MKQTKRRLIASALGATLLLGIAAVPASAYFTSWDQASGGILIHKPGTTITEDYAGGEKTVVITIDEDTAPVFVRARAYIPADLVSNKYGEAEVYGEGWTATGGVTDWYVYGTSTTDLTTLSATSNPNTTPLKVKFTFPFDTTDVEKPTTTGSDDSSETGGESKISTVVADGTNYNVVVVYETSPAVYDADGNPVVPANWQ